MVSIEVRKWRNIPQEKEKNSALGNKWLLLSGTGTGTHSQLQLSGTGTHSHRRNCVSNLTGEGLLKMHVLSMKEPKGRTA